MGYRDGDRTLYVTPYNNLGEVLYVFDNIVAYWSSLWLDANEEFDVMIRADFVLAQFAGKMFFVREGNHRLSAWWRHVNNHHSLDKIGIPLFIALL